MISPALLKLCAPALIVPVTDLFNYWIWSGTFPEDLKKSVIIPVFKKGDPMSRENYRPISLLPALAKLFEISLLQQLEKYFEQFFPADMFGFRKGLGCEHALLELTEQCRKDLDSKQHSLLLSLDLSKAFDTVNHRLLLEKLKAYGLDASALSLLEHYLRHRTQCTRVEGNLSTEKEVRSGVPQGSVIGPFLFNIFVADLSLALDCFIVRYADDTTLLLSGITAAELQIKAKVNLEKAAAWFYENYLLNNKDKVQMLLCGRCESEEWKDFTLEIDGVTISPGKNLRLLGVILDPFLSFNDHISMTLRKTGNALRLARGVKNMLSTGERMLTLNAYVLPHLLFCCALLSGINKTQATRVQRLINIAKHSMKIENFHFSFLDRCEKRSILLLHQAIHTGTPQNFTAGIHLSRGNYLMRGAPRILLPPARTNMMKHSVSFIASKLWNGLPAEAAKQKTTPKVAPLKSYLEKW